MNPIKKHVFYLTALTIACAGYGCHSGGQHTEALPGDTATARDEVLELTKEQIRAVGIRIDTVTRKNMHAVVAASGQLAVPPQNRADVNVLLGGIIREIYVQEGEVVRKGQRLALLENPDLIKLQQDYLSTENAFVFTKEERQRQQELSEAQAGRGKTLQQAVASFNMQEAKLRSLEKRLEVLGISPASVKKGDIVSAVAIRAPISGTVGHIIVNTGTYAAPDKPLMEIIDNSKVHADLIVFEKDLFKVKVGQDVQFVLTNQDDREVSGRIYGINKSFENETKGIIVHAAIKDAGRGQLIPGMYVRGLINIGNDWVPAVPEAAVVHAEGRDFIFVLEDSTADGKKMQFRRLEVVPGIRELGFVQITPVEKFDGGVRVVVKGAFYLLSAQKASGDEDE